MGVSIVIRGRTVFARIGATTTTTTTRCRLDQVLKNSIQALPPFVMFLFSVLLLLPPMEACAPSKPASEAQPSPGQICAQVICCGSDGVTYSTPAGVTCVDYNECPAPQPPLPPIGCPGCPVTGGAVLSPENQAIVDWTVDGLQGSDGLCKKTKVEVNNFSTQVVAGTMYEFDLVLDHAEDSAAECGAPDGLREVCHMAVWEKVWEDFREVQWDRSTCIRPGTN